MHCLAPPAATSTAVACPRPSPSWRVSPRRGGVHSRCLPVGLHVRMLRCVPFIQRQRDTLCLTHAFNKMLQHPRLHPSDMCSAFPPGQALHGDYHVHELSHALHHISPHITLINGHPHMGATDNADFLATVRGQPHEHPLLDCAILTIHRDQRAPGGTHHVAAVILPLCTATPEWFVLDSCRPEMVFRCGTCAMHSCLTQMYHM